MPPNSLIDEKKYSPDHKGQKITELRSKKSFFLTKKKKNRVITDRQWRGYQWRYSEIS